MYQCFRMSLSFMETDLLEITYSITVAGGQLQGAWIACGYPLTPRQDNGLTCEQEREFLALVVNVMSARFRSTCGTKLHEFCHCPFRMKHRNTDYAIIWKSQIYSSGEKNKRRSNQYQTTRLIIINNNNNICLSHDRLSSQVRQGHLAWSTPTFRLSRRCHGSLEQAHIGRTIDH